MAIIDLNTGSVDRSVDDAVPGRTIDLNTGEILSPEVGSTQEVAQPVQQVIPASSPRSARASQAQQQRTQEEDLFQGFQQGKATSQDLSDEEIDIVRKKRLDAIPEIAGRFPQLSENLEFTDALAAMTAFDPDEFGAILKNADPDIGIATTPEGERIAVNNKTGMAFSINKVGPSLVDAFQFGSVAAAFTPAGAAKTIAGEVVASAATQAGIETLQEVKGGDFDVEDVALAGATIPAVAQTVKQFKPVAERLKKLSSHITSSKPLAESFLFKMETPTKKAVREALEEGSTDNKVAGYILNQAGKVGKNKLERGALKQGFEPGTVAAMQGATRPDRKQMSEMVRVLKKGTENKLFRNNNRPSDVVGQTVLSRWQAVKSLNKEAAEKLDDVADGLIGQQVDLSSVEQNFLKAIKKQGVTVGEEGLEFSRFGVSKNPKAKKLITEIYDDLQAVGNDANSAHQMKQSIDDAVDFAKSEGGQIGKAESVAKTLRREINLQLQELSPEYKQVNTQFADTRGAMDDFQKAVGSTIDPDSEGADKALGTVSRSLLSNIRSRERLRNGMQGLSNAAGKYNRNFDDSIDMQLMFADELETLFGSFSPTSLKGEMERAVKTGFMSPQGAKQLIQDAGEHVIDAARGVNEQNAIKAIERLLKETK